MMALTKKPLCGQCEAGNVYDESGEGDPVVTRCPCRSPFATPEQQRDKGMAGTAEANPDAFKAALRIIRDAARANPVLSSNSVRHEMRLAQIPGPVVGAAFQQAAKDRVLRRIGYVASTEPSTHSHPVVEWASLIHRPGGTAA